nr:hypothetical protein [Tanacetum cinerariifolium]
MHIRASNSKRVEPLHEPEHTLNRRLRRRNKRVSFEQRNNPPQHPRIAYPPILDINYFCHFLDILQNYDQMDDEPMWAADRVVHLTLGSAITIPETENEFAIKGCKGQGGAGQAGGSSQQSQGGRQAAGVRNVSCQAAVNRKKGPRQGASARNASSQAVGSNEPSVAP